jgi:hypothetical protein
LREQTALRSETSEQKFYIWTTLSQNESHAFKPIYERNLNSLLTTTSTHYYISWYRYVRTSCWKNR